MQQAAGRARALLPEGGKGTAGFVRGQWRGPIGFLGRAKSGDLYYTVFALESLRALGAPIPRWGVARYLRSFGAGESLDLVHLCCLVRARAVLGDEALPPGADPRALARRALDRLAEFRSADGGFAPVPGAARGTAYGAFLALGACQDLGADVPDPDALAASVESLRLPDGGYANQPALEGASTPATAAACTLLRHLGRRCEPATGEWLLARASPAGGLVAAEGAPMTDLLSTATGLHALVGMGVSLDAVREPCLRFVRSLLTAEGPFRATHADDTGDCEYTFYGLLALGHLNARA